MSISLGVDLTIIEINSLPRFITCNHRDGRSEARIPDSADRPAICDLRVWGGPAGTGVLSKAM